MAQHTNYWSCTRFADWLRGTPKLNAGTSEQWDNWNKSAKRIHPIRYWLAEEGLDYLQDFLTWPFRKLYDIKYYINNRWVTHTHCLSASPVDIRPGRWCDVGNRFLPCLFNELVNFVEIETAWAHVAWDKEERKKFKVPFYATGWFKWRTWRSPEAGLAHLDWASSLVVDEDWGVKRGKKGYGEPTQQALAAQEIKALYLWWTQTYRNRRDPYDASGWTAHCERMREKYPDKFLSSINSKDPEDVKAANKASKLLQRLEKEYREEDEQMLIRLIKIKDSLWT